MKTKVIMSNLLRLVLAILLLLCLDDMQYGYFQLVRTVSAGFFAYLSYEYFRSNKVEYSFAYGTLALLFQPFCKVALGRTIWNIVDVLVATILICSVLKVFISAILKKIKRK